MKQLIVNILEKELRIAESSLARAKDITNTMSKEELEKEFGNSGLTGWQVLAQYQAKVSELSECIKFMEK